MSFPSPSTASRVFVGRRQELGLLLERLAAGRRLVTIVGPSGIGKTRLAQQLAEAVAAAGASAAAGQPPEPDPTAALGMPVASAARGTPSEQDPSSAASATTPWFCSLVGCVGVADIEAAVAHALGMPTRHGLDLARALRSRGPLLLILDNVNELAPMVAQVVEPWLERAPELQILATSLLPLGLELEEVLALGPLEPADAIALYFERAHRKWANRSPLEDEADAVHELVRRLDRVPLAIELAAARVLLLPPRALLSKLARRFELIGTSAASGASRSLTEALELTWELLPVEERSLLAMASVFEGGFTADAAIEVFGAAEDVDATRVLATLEGLRSKAVLYQEDQRLHLFESVQLHALAKLRASGRWEEAIRLHAVHYLESGANKIPNPFAPASSESLTWLQEERANLLAIHRRFQGEEAALSARAGLLLTPILRLDAIHASETHVTETTLAAARENGEPKLLLQALRLRARFLFMTTRHREALLDLEEALQLAESRGDREGEAHVLLSIGNLRALLAEWEEATAQLWRAIEVSREVGIPTVEAQALRTLGMREFGRLAFDEATSLLGRARELSRDAGDRLGEANILFSLAWVWAKQGLTDDARRASEEVISVSRAAGDRVLEADALTNLGAILVVVGDSDEGVRITLEALERQRAFGNRGNEATCIANLGVSALLRGDLDVAEESFLQAEAVLLEAELPDMRAVLLNYIALLEGERGNLEEARAALEEARVFFRASNREQSLLESGFVEGALQVAEALSLPQARRAEAEELITKARAQLLVLPAERRAFLVPAKLLERGLARWDERCALGPSPRERLFAHPDGDWFQWEGGEKVLLQHRQVLRPLFATLVKLRLRSPGEAIEPHALFEAGWAESGDELPPDIALRRLYFGIWTLRSLGLRDVLLNLSDGYLLDPHVAVEVR